MSETDMCVHVRACRDIHARLIILKFPMKMNDLVPSSPAYFIFIGYLKTGGMEGVRANPMKPNWIRHCLYMHANAQTFWLHYAWACNSYVLQKYMGRVVLWIRTELSYKHGPSWHGPSFLLAELACAELFFLAVLSVIRLVLPFTATMRSLF